MASPPKDVIVGLDAGTSVIKSVAFDLGGRQLGVAAVPNSFASVAGGGAEQDLDRTWRDAARTLRELADVVPDLAHRIAAVSVTGQGDGTWLIDGDGLPVGPAWLWLDARSGALVEQLRRDPSDRARFEATGTGVVASQQGPQLLWMKRHRPELLDRAATAFHCKDWLYFRLTGDRATDPSEGVCTFGDFRTRTYSDTVLDALDLESHRRLLPPMVDGTTELGRLSDAVAAETGLLPGTPVVLAYIDIVCTALGAGLYEPGSDIGCSIVGSTGMNMRLAENVAAVKLDASASGYTLAMPAPGVYTQLQTNLAATLNIDWLLGLAADVCATVGVERTRRDLLAALDTWVTGAAPGSLLYQPYIALAGERGPFIDTNARAGFIGLSITHGFADLARAVLEGLAFAARDCFAAMGPLPSEIRLTGGAARSAALRRIVAGVTRSAIRVSSREEAGAAGAAMIAAVGLGIYPTMADCAAEWVTPLLGAPDLPDSDLAAIYDGLFPSYLAARTALAPVWRSMAERPGIGRRVAQ